MEQLWGRERAQAIALLIEYDPQSPVGRGSPHDVPPDILDREMVSSQRRFNARLQLLRKRMTG